MTAPTDSFASLDGAIDAAVRLIEQLQRERDELVAALKRIADLRRGEGDEQAAFSLLRQCGDIARAALARIEGEKP